MGKRVKPIGTSHTIVMLGEDMIIFQSMHIENVHNGIEKLR